MTAAPDLDLIRGAAREAGGLALQMREGEVKTWSKAGGSPVTEADLAVDRLLKQRLREARPDYGWLSEETKDDSSRLTARRAFVVDPIDGTIAYIRGRPWWSVSIAVVEDGRPVAGVVFAPAVGETYEASAGAGARLNGVFIQASERAEIEGAAVIADEPFLTGPGWPEPWPQMRIERRNSLAYRLALVAAGSFDAAIAISHKHDWDLAAGDLIVREAGGRATDHLGRTFAYNQPSTIKPSLVSAGAALHPLILARVGHIDLTKPK
jgi:myo-inositol-1(or 4)-monophosphatase